MLLRLLLGLIALLTGGGNHHHRLRVLEPRPYEVWDGRVRGYAPAGVESVPIVFRGHRWTVPVSFDGSFDAVLRGAPLGDGRVRAGAATITPVYSLPTGSLRPLAAPQNDPSLDRRLRLLARAADPDVAAELRRPDGTAAAYNAGAEFEAASTLKLPSMLAALATIHGELTRSAYWEPFEEITRYSDNGAEDQLLDLLGGSETGGAARMVAFVRSLGLHHTYMEGGYLTTYGVGGGPPPVTSVDPPPAAYKYTTADDMAHLADWLADAAAGTGPLLRRGVSEHEARELLYLMLHADDPGLVKAGARGLPVAHKIGWLDDSRDDVAIVFGRNGQTVVTVYCFGDIDDSAYQFGADVARVATRGD
jgi:beta-lactamase class A